jgi:hypothetical protein
LLTVSDPVPWFCKSTALSATVNVVEFANVVGFALLFHITTEFDSNPVPVTVTVTATPGGTYRGETPEIAATGLFTVNGVAPDAPPPGVGFTTTIWAVELPVSCEAGTTAVSFVLLMTVVVIADPFHSAAELAINPEPLIVTVVLPVPAVTALGVIPLMLGVGF